MNNCKIAIAGIGVVGKNVLDYIVNNAELLTTKCNNHKPIITAIASRSERNYKNITWYNDPLKMLEDNSTDIFIELIGGADGIAYDFIHTALAKGKNVITANKALIAKHGTKLFALAQQNNCCLYFEAAVAGAVPIIKILHDNLSGNKISEIYGILNGTCNFILSEMAKSDISFAAILKLAQEKGFAEADPTLDIEGIDAAHKIAILSAIAFNTEINFNSVEIKGISNIKNSSFKIAAELGYSIKLLAKSSLNNGKINHYVRPFMVNKQYPIASVNNALNSVYIKSDLALDTILTSHGAGGKPTASSVIANICDITRNNKQFFPNINNYDYVKYANLEQKFLIYFTHIEQYNLCKKLFDKHNISYQHQNNKANKYTLIFATNELGKTEQIIDKLNYMDLFEIYE
ncbi:MAG: homoserine dehydrogenase [Rickettsiales bacterium]